MALLIGFVICFTILITSLYLAYYRTLQEAEIFLSKHTISANEKIRVFLNEIKLSLEDISKHKKNCNVRTHDALKRLVLNEPQISIAYFKTKDTQCASIEQFQFTAIPNIEKPNFILEGPNQIKDILQNAFILQLNHKDKKIGVIFPRRILDKLLHEPTNSFVQHTLFNERTKNTNLPHSICVGNGRFIWCFY